MANPERIHPTPAETEPTFQIVSALNPAALPGFVEQLTQGIHEIDKSAFDEPIWLNKETIREAVLQNSGGLWLAIPSEGNLFDPQNMIAYMMTSHKRPGIAYIEGIGVRPEWRRRHVALKLAATAAWTEFQVWRMEAAVMTMRTENTAVRELGKAFRTEVTHHLGSNFPDGQSRDELRITREAWKKIGIGQESPDERIESSVRLRYQPEPEH